MPFEFAESVTYTVQQGDTLFGIAAAHAVAMEAIVAANAGLIEDPGFILPGWELVIPGQLSGTRRGPAPAGEGVTSHTIQVGDTLGMLAERWGTTVSAIAELNGIVNANLVFVGQRIRRPGATVTASSDPGTAPVAPRQLVFSRWPLDMPPGVVTGGYRQDYGGYLHRGIDIGHVPVGTPVFAPAGGVVTVHRPGDGWGDGSFGINVVIDHPGTPWWSIYAHLNETGRSTGDRVQAGEVIGEVGFTGFVVPAGQGGAHLHWQLSAHSGFPAGFEYIANPLDFLAAA